MDIIDQIRPAIVSILLTDEKQDLQNAKPNGTGFFITSNGYILTCYHVVEPMIVSKNRILVKTVTGVFEADYIAEKSRSDNYFDWAI